MDDQRQIKILYVEDDPPMRTLFKSVMESNGYAVELAESGRDGIEKFAASSHEIVALDYGLPDMSGLDVAREALRINPDQVIVIITGEGSEAVAAEALAMGVTDYVVKHDDQTYFELLPAVVMKQEAIIRRRWEVAAEAKVMERRNNRFRNLFENAQVGILRGRMSDGKLSEANNRIVEMLGYPSVDRLMEEYRPENHWLDMKHREAFVSAGRRDGVNRSFETEFVRLDGSKFQVELSAMFYPDEDQYETVFVDITDRKRAEDDLALSEERFRQLADNMREGIQVIDRDGKPLYVNRATASIFGFGSVEEMLGLETLAGVVAPHELERLRDYRHTRLAGQSAPSEYEYEGRKKDGTSIWLRQSSQVVNWNGEPAVQSTLIDITEKKQADEALGRSEQRYRKLVESLADALVIHRDGYILYVNRGAGELFGAVRPEDLIGTPIKDRVHESSLDLSTRRMESVLESGQRSPLTEHTFLKLDGSHVAVEATTSVVEWEGEPALQALLRDVSEQSKMRQQLVQAQKMEAIGHLTGGVAHDFNNLLQVISGASAMVQSTMGDAAQQVKWLDQIVSTTEHGARLTGQLLAFSRQQHLHTDIIDLPSDIAGIEEILARTLGEDISLSVRVEEGVPQLQADSNALQNALLNLAINARGAMPEGGNLSIGVSGTTLQKDLDVDGEVVAAGDYIEIVVADTGSGMPKDVLKKAFDPFFTTKDVGEGTGLGLSMVYGFARQSGGYARIESEVGAGTKVTLTLPAILEAGKKSASRRLSSETKSQTGTVLVVEDDSTVRQTTSAMLRRIGWEVVEAVDGKNALKILDDGQDFDLLFSDVVMPGGVSGFDIAETVAERSDGPRILLTSGYPDRMDAGGENAPRGLTILKKPYSLQQLQEAIADIMAAP